MGKSYIYDYKGNVSQVSNTVGSTFRAEYSAISPYNGLNISDYHDSCREEEGSGSPYPRNACECSNSVFYAEQELGIDYNLSRILYYYHPDYLGHNEYITDITGRPYPYFHYSAFGESLIERNTNYGQFSSPYRFNGKELDPETGNYYYGARYYNPTWSVWLSVDPLADQFPSWTPYHFVHNNPINLIDPTGMSAESSEDWVPGVDKNGNATYTAEAGDNANTLASQYGFTQEQAEKITGTTGSTPIAEGTQIEGCKAYEATGSDVLKLDLNSERATHQRKFDQLVFSIDHSKAAGKNTFKPLDYFTGKEALIGGFTGVGGLTGKDVKLGDIDIRHFDADIYWNTPINNFPNNISSDGEKVIFRWKNQPKILIRTTTENSGAIYNRFE